LSHYPAERHRHAARFGREEEGISNELCLTIISLGRLEGATLQGGKNGASKEAVKRTSLAIHPPHSNKLRDSGTIFFTPTLIEKFLKTLFERPSLVLLHVKGRGEGKV
jgi:hypothetical protein